MALTDLHDSWVDNALVGAPEPGSIIRVRIIGPVPGAPSQFMLSLRPRDLAEGGGGKGRAAKAAEADGAPPESLPAEDLQPGQRVCAAACCCHCSICSAYAHNPFPGNL